jgi:hypothetical protein
MKWNLNAFFSLSFIILAIVGIVAGSSAATIWGCLITAHVYLLYQDLDELKSLVRENR